MPLHRAQLAANEVCGLELGRGKGLAGRHKSACVLLENLQR